MFDNIEVYLFTIGIIGFIFGRTYQWWLNSRRSK